MQRIFTEPPASDRACASRAEQREAVGFARFDLDARLGRHRRAAPQHRQDGQQAQQVERCPEHRHRNVRIVPPAVGTGDERGKRKEDRRGDDDTHPAIGSTLVAASLRRHVEGHVAEGEDKIPDDVRRDANADHIAPDAVQ